MGKGGRKGGRRVGKREGRGGSGGALGGERFFGVAEPPPTPSSSVARPPLCSSRLWPRPCLFGTQTCLPNRRHHEARPQQQHHQHRTIRTPVVNINNKNALRGAAVERTNERTREAGWADLVGFPGSSSCCTDSSRSPVASLLFVCLFVRWLLL